MKSAGHFFLAIVLLIVSTPLLSYSQVQPMLTTVQKESKEVIVIMRFPSSISANYTPVPGDFILATETEQLAASQIMIAPPSRVNMMVTFEVNSSSFVILEGLVSNTDTAATGYYITNTQPILMADSTQMGAGGLKTYMLNRIPTISSTTWESYILDDYSAHYLFPQLFHIGTEVNPQDSADRSFYLEVQESKSWAPLLGSLSLNWGIEGRVSTSKTDSLQYAKIYPLVAQLNGISSRGALMAGVESGYEGFGKKGRVALKGVYQFRLPYNPVDLTLGFSRWRINPVLNLSVQGNAYWSDTALPDSLKSGADATLSLRYDIPVGKSYYLQTFAQGNYSTLTKELQYLYNFSFGYIIDGSIQVLASYQQGYQNVTYTFDKQLLIGIAISALNSNISK